MVLKKQKWFLQISVILLLLSCKNEATIIISDNTQLECILDTYIRNNKTKNNSYIYVNENQYWSDTTSVISLSLVNTIIHNDNIKLSVYKNNKIIYLLSSFKNYTNKNNTISNKLKWDYKFNSNNELKENYVSEYEMQFIYNVKNKCISKILKTYPINDSIILKEIKKCLCK